MQIPSVLTLCVATVAGRVLEARQASSSAASRSSSSAFSKPTQQSAPTTNANSTIYDLSRHYCRLWRHSSVLANGKIYIDGGNTYVPQNNGNYDTTAAKQFDQGMNSFLLSVDLSANFTSQDSFPYKAIPKGDKVPNGLIEGTLWYSAKAKSIYQLGGWFSFNSQSSPIFVQAADIPDPAIWQYSLDSGIWTQADAALSKNLFHRPGAAAYCDAPAIGRSYAFQGMIQQRSEKAAANFTPSTDELFLEGMLELDMTKSDAVVNNITVPQYIPPRLNGAMAHLPIGDKGVVVQIGGQEPGPSTPMSDGSVIPLANSKAVNINLTYVDIYDIQTGYWFRQQTFGVPDMPVGRSDICTVVVSAADGSSHNIIMVDGVQTYNGVQTFSEIWALSVPSFTWIKLYNGTTGGRYGHTCHLAGENILVVGGMETLSAGGNVQTCDSHMPVNVFSIPVNNYTGVFNHDGASRAAPVPDAVVSVIGGSSKGNAYITQPTVWNDVYLQYVFNPTLQRPAYTPTYQLYDVSTASTTSSPAASTAAVAPPSSGSSAGGIAGGVVGGLAALAILVGALLFMRRRRNNKRDSATRGTHSPPGNMSELPAPRDEHKSPTHVNVDEALPEYKAHELPSPPMSPPMGYTDREGAISPPVELPGRMTSNASRRSRVISGVVSPSTTFGGPLDRYE